MLLSAQATKMVIVDINLWMFSGAEAHYIHFLEACQLDIVVGFLVFCYQGSNAVSLFLCFCLLAATHFDKVLVVKVF